MDFFLIVSIFWPFLFSNRLLSRRFFCLDLFHRTSILSNDFKLVVPFFGCLLFSAIFFFGCPIILDFLIFCNFHLLFFEQLFTKPLYLESLFLTKTWLLRQYLFLNYFFCHHLALKYKKKIQRFYFY